MLRGTSKNPQCFRFDLPPKHGVETGSGHHVSFQAQDTADSLLDIDQFDEAEPWIVRVEGQVDVAVRSGFLAGDGTEQVKPCHPDAVKIGLMGAQSRDHIVSTHHRLRDA
jgi:hypothetical protein